MEYLNLRPHQVLAFIEFSRGTRDPNELRRVYGDDFVGLLSTWVNILNDLPNEKLILISRSASSLCEAKCLRRNSDPDQLCDTSHALTITKEVAELRRLGLKERILTGYSLNELREAVSAHIEDDAHLV